MGKYKVLDPEIPDDASRVKSNLKFSRIIYFSMLMMVVVWFSGTILNDRNAKLEAQLNEYLKKDFFVPECLSSFAWNGENLFNCTGSYGTVSKEVQTEEVVKFLNYSDKAWFYAYDLKVERVLECQYPGHDKPSKHHCNCNLIRDTFELNIQKFKSSIYNGLSTTERYIKNLVMIKIGSVNFYPMNSFFWIYACFVQALILLEGFLVMRSNLKESGQDSEIASVNKEVSAENKKRTYFLLITVCFYFGLLFFLVALSGYNNYKLTQLIS